ncbi:MAG: type IV pili methyl-accepting chemotaxis transducer N-terminal domain-containing protein [Lacisediminimonas sp.]|nr:type IV pili methyl-accepting chemotaxis transducer N-terminal domain-containing protein [Lacisediminimonas sp.]
MPKNASLSSKLGRVGASLLVVALVSIGLTLWVTWQLEGGAAAVNEAGRMRMQAWRLASAVQASPEKSAELVRQFDDSLAVLRSGDPGRPLFVPQDPQIRDRFAAVEALWQTQRGQWLSTPPPDAVASAQAAGHFVDAIELLVFAIEQNLSRLTAILNLFQFVMMALAIAGAIVVIYTGYWYVISPLGRVQQGLRTVEAGDFTTRIEVDTQDEFGQVAAGFNRMAETLQSLYEGLEAKVVDKTRRIEAQRMRLESLYQISAFLARASTINELAHGFAQRVRVVMKADATVVRWSDEASQRYLMLASDCFPLDLIEEERSLLHGACSCGSLQPDARTRVIPIVSHHEEPVRHCARVGYQNVVSVPIRFQQRLLGELNLFFRSDIAPTADEIELLDALASNLASALESLRASALEREAAVSEERTLLARNLHDSIAQSLSFLKIQVQLLRNADQRGDQARLHEALDELDNGLRESISDVRELLLHFRTRTNTDDIEQALQETLRKFQHQTGLPTHLQVEGHGLPLPPDTQVQVLHVVQEAMSNVRKHARATQVILEVFKGPSWRFVVRDNGVGFDASKAAGESHVGMKIMRERAMQIGAQVESVSSPGQGTTVTLSLPVYEIAASDPAAADAVDVAAATLPAAMLERAGAHD